MARKIISISPWIVAGAALVRLGGLLLMQYLIGMNLIDLWHHWMLPLIIGG